MPHGHHISLFYTLSELPAPPLFLNDTRSFLEVDEICFVFPRTSMIAVILLNDECTDVHVLDLGPDDHASNDSLKLDDASPQLQEAVAYHKGPCIFLNQTQHTMMTVHNSESTSKW